MSAEAGTMPNATNLKEEIDKKLCQVLAICYVIRDGRDTGEAVKDSLWAIDDLVEDAKRAVQELYEQAQEAES